MRYLGLLRGVNVGGKGTVPMAELRSLMLEAGLREVKTYINSGNVIFESDAPDRASAAVELARIIRTGFGFDVEVLVLDTDGLRGIVGALDPGWKNDQSMRCDVMFLWPDVDSPAALEQITIDPSIEDVLYTPCAIIWRVDRANVRKSRVPKIIGSPLYKRLTGRNCNTARKLLELLES